jgi:hypothetical protein
MTDPRYFDTPAGCHVAPDGRHDYSVIRRDTPLAACPLAACRRMGGCRENAHARACRREFESREDYRNRLADKLEALRDEWLKEARPLTFTNEDERLAHERRSLRNLHDALREGEARMLEEVRQTREAEGRGPLWKGPLPAAT